MKVYYNENCDYAAEWLRNLSDAREIPPGYVDSRDIRDVSGNDLVGYRQAHFFGGIGIWARALADAGWPGDKEIWSGSCPCQPFSAAGKGKGFADERHLWPSWHWLIEQRRPDVIVGEQVSSPDGRTWLDLVFTDLEGTGYACGAIIAPASGVGAPHGRHRTYWMAYANGRQRHRLTNGQGRESDRETAGRLESDGKPLSGRQIGGSDMGDAESGGRERRPGSGENIRELGGASDAGGPWQDVEWLRHSDGKHRPTQARVFQMVDGHSLYMGLVGSDQQAKIECLVNEAAKRLSITSGEILRTVQDAVASEGVSIGTGRPFNFYEAQILLYHLLQYARPQRAESNSNYAQCSGNSIETKLRMLRRNSPAGDSPCERGLEGQPLGELSDSLCELSSAMARAAQAFGNQMLQTYAPASFPLGSLLYEDSMGKIRSPNRVGRLRAYGNAIALPQAVYFIKAVMRELKI